MNVYGKLTTQARVVRRVLIGLFALAVANGAMISHSYADDLIRRIELPAIPVDFAARTREPSGFSAQGPSPSLLHAWFNSGSGGYQSITAADINLRPTSLLAPAALKLPNAKSFVAPAAPMIQQPATAHSIAPVASRRAADSTGAMPFVLACCALLLSCCAAYLAAHRYTRVQRGPTRVAAYLARVDRGFSNVGDELHSQLEVLLLTAAIGVSALCRAIFAVWASARTAAALLVSPDVLRKLARLIDEIPRGLYEAVFVSRTRRYVARWALVLFMVFTSTIAGTPLNALAVVVTFDSDGNATNGVTENINNPFTWVPGTTASFYNPLTQTDVAAGSGDIAVFGAGNPLQANYTVNVARPGTYRIRALYAFQTNSVTFDLNGKSAATCRLPVPTTSYHHWNLAEIGTIEFPEAGRSS